MSQKLRVEFMMPVRKRKSAPKPDPGVKAQWPCQDRATRKARNIALAYWIDEKIQSGEVADMASMAKLCGVSRARVTKVVDLLGLPTSEQEQILD